MTYSIVARDSQTGELGVAVQSHWFGTGRWAGLGIVGSGDLDRGLSLVREAIALQPGWAGLLPRRSADVHPVAPAVCEHLGLLPS